MSPCRRRVIANSTLATTFSGGKSMSEVGVRHCSWPWSTLILVRPYDVQAEACHTAKFCHHTWLHDPTGVTIMIGARGISLLQRWLDEYAACLFKPKASLETRRLGGSRPAEPWWTVETRACSGLRLSAVSAGEDRRTGVNR